MAKLPITEKDKRQMLEYSDDPETLKGFIDELEIEFSGPVVKKFFEEDEQARNVYQITLKRGNKKAKFQFGDSIVDTEKGRLVQPYDILTSVGLDYTINIDDFEDYAADFGIDADSRKAFQKWKSFRPQIRQLRAMFTDEEAEALPR